MPRRYILDYPVRRLADYDDEREYEQLGTTNQIVRETQNALLIRIYDWDKKEVWFPRSHVWKDDEDVLWTDRQMWDVKKREHDVS